VSESFFLSLLLLGFSIWCSLYALKDPERATTLLVLSWLGYGIKIALLQEWVYTHYLAVWGGSVVLFIGINWTIKIRRILRSSDRLVVPESENPPAPPREIPREWFQQ
jgi:hypothetical protein